MSYLIFNDYRARIQNLNLMQVIGGDMSIIDAWQRNAEEKAVSRLTQKYDTEQEFTNTVRWDYSKSYFAADRVYLDAPVYASATNYLLHDQTLYNGSVYIATAPTTETFDLTKWSLLGTQYELFYVTYPHDPFNINLYYPKGSVVYWKGFVYTSISDGSIAANLNIQYGQYRNVPQRNAFPGNSSYPDGSNGYSQWGTGIAYSAPAGTLPTDTVYWTRGDNRSQEMIQTLSDIVLFLVHQRISPQNIPVNRVEAYRMAIQWLVDASTGIVTPKLPLRQPDSGFRIRYGGNIQNNNHY